MSSPATRPRDTHEQTDDLDDLFNYDASMEDAFNEVDTGRNSEKRSEPNSNQNTAGLGIDEEITIAKKRQPVAKLDEARLLSPAGIPKLRRISKEKLKFKGKGHEFSDVTRLLNMYQLWLDDLYPRAKFADGLALIEKLGHKKRMQIMRREWINEGKPKPSMETDAGTPEQEERENPQEDEAQETELRQDGEQAQEMSAPPAGANTAPSPHSHDPGEDELDALLDRDMLASATQVHAAPGSHADGPDDDELDALLAEEMKGGPEKGSLGGSGLASDSRKFQQDQDDGFADEMEAMEGLEDW